MAACIIISPFGVATESFPGGTQYVTDSVRFAPLSDEHKARISDYLDAKAEATLSRLVRMCPAFVVPYSDVAFLKGVGDAQERGGIALEIHRFCLEYFSGSGIPMAAFAYDGSTVTHQALERTDQQFKAENVTALPDGAWDRHAAYLKFAYKSVAVAPASQLCIRRLSRAFRQGSTVDGIIDLAIALECLLEAKMEIKFQFSLFHSLLNVADPGKRLEVFELLQVLYDARSVSVHGGTVGKSDKKKMERVEESWKLLIEIARQNFTYYLLFCKCNGSSGWAQHLKTLSFGAPRLELEMADD